MQLIIAEKPSVARDLAQCLGVKPQGRGYFQSDAYLITWAIGHLVTLAEPHDINPAWQKWREKDLPILPDEWPLRILPDTSDQFAQIKALMHRADVQGIVAATDAGREGELIFRYIYEKAACTKPVRRLWLSSLTQDSIREAFAKLQPLAHYDRLADNARGRSRADWLVGLNLSRAYSLKYDGRWTVGRVQTPTLAMLVERTEAIQNFVPEAYVELEAKFQVPGSDDSYRAFYVQARAGASAKGQATLALQQAHRFKPDDPELANIQERARTGHPEILRREDKQQSVPPPKFYDLTELQKDANRLFGFQAKQTLDIAQKLYESHKLITYPRSDSRYLSSSVAKAIGPVVDAIRAPYESLGFKESTGLAALGRDYVDDSKVSDHHAIIPSGKRPDSVRLNDEESRIFDLIARRLLMAWQDDHKRSQSSLLTQILNTNDGQTQSDLYRASGSVVLQEGWKRLERRSQKSEGGPLLPALAAKTPVTLSGIKALAKETRPPAAFTDATLLNGMASAGSHLDDKELGEILRERGLGTPATRASMIETLIQRGYVQRQERSLRATEAGIQLIHCVHPTVRSAALTGEWEARLRLIERGELSLEAFMRDIVAYVQETVDLVKKVSAPISERSRSFAGAAVSAPKSSGPPQIPAARPAPGKSEAPVPNGEGKAQESMQDVLLRVFGHSRFREHQAQICKEIIAGEDLLLVMPTGAGKSLCYQLPAIVRPGCCIVISPLIALMDDQVNRLKSLGVAAGALHSGLTREQSKAIFRSYLEGHLKLLYLAPERLGLSGFLELLAKHPPSLIAIDEAHCISQWGHDFRPDYRMLAQRLPLLRPAPIVGMTATATPLVQKDIAEQLGLHKPKLHIHGFRRRNIAIEITELPLPDRPALVKRLLKQTTMRPAIIYAPTRKETEHLASTLGSTLRVAAYHAGLQHDVRQQVQESFQAGTLDVIVATVAFGMGIDKGDIRTVIHTALPSSVESYYQEIGRAGRDGKVSRAILLHSYADHRTREFFVKKNYPDISVLESVLKRIPPDGISRASLRTGLEAEVLDNALEKLWIHGAIDLTSSDELRRLSGSWQKSYLAQQSHKESELKLMADFAQSQGACRMQLFLRHFGDTTDREQACGLCDVCHPQGTLSQTYSSPDPLEQVKIQKILATLAAKPLSFSKLCLQAEDWGLERRRLEAILGALLRAEWIWQRQETFESDGRIVQYRNLGLSKTAGENLDLASLQILDLPPASETGSWSRPSRKGATKRTKKSATRDSKKVEKGTHANAALMAAISEDDPLAQRLRGWRLQKAKAERKPAYRIFSDRTLAALLERRPQSPDDLGEVAGIGPLTLQNYGREILQILNTEKP